MTHVKYRILSPTINSSSSPSNRTGTSKNIKFSLDVTGHADFAQDNDIVCSACSTLAYTLGEALLHVQPDCKIQMNSGEFYAEITSCSPQQSEKLNTIFQTILYGYRLLSNTYPNNVCLEICEENY